MSERRRADRDEGRDRDSAERDGGEVRRLIGGHAGAHRDAAPAVRRRDCERPPVTDAARSSRIAASQSRDTPTSNGLAAARSASTAITDPLVPHEHRGERDEDQTGGGPGSLTRLDAARDR